MVEGIYVIEQTMSGLFQFSKGFVFSASAFRRPTLLTAAKKSTK